MDRRAPAGGAPIRTLARPPSGSPRFATHRWPIHRDGFRRGWTCAGGRPTTTGPVPPGSPRRRDVGGAAGPGSGDPSAGIRPRGWDPTPRAVRTDRWSGDPSPPPDGRDEAPAGADGGRRRSRRKGIRSVSGPRIAAPVFARDRARGRPSPAGAARPPCPSRRRSRRRHRPGRWSRRAIPRWRGPGRSRAGRPP